MRPFLQHGASMALLAIAAIGLACNDNKSRAEETGTPDEGGDVAVQGEPSKPPRSLGDRLRRVESAKIRGTRIQVGDLADDVFAVIKPVDVIGSSDIRSDPSISGSLIVTHTCRINFDTIRLEFRRTIDPGPYRVAKIWFSETGGK